MKRVDYYIGRKFSDHIVDPTWDGPFKTEIEAQRVFASRYHPDGFFIQKTTTYVKKIKARRVRAKRSS